MHAFKFFQVFEWLIELNYHVDQETDQSTDKHEKGKIVE